MMMKNAFSFRHSACLIILISLLLCLSAIAQETPSQPAPQETKPLVGQTLLKTKKELVERNAKLQAELSAVNKEIEAVEKEKADLQLGFSNMLLSRGFSMFRSSGALAILIPIIWVCLLLVMYRNIRKESFEKNKPLLMKLLWGFIALGILCFLTGIAGASTEGTLHMPGSDLPDTLESIRKTESVELWRRVLHSLEESNCTRVEIPSQVMSMISANCPDAEFPNPVEGQGPHRLAAIAAIYWASGDKVRALEKLKPIVNERFNPRSSSNAGAFKTAVCLFASQNDAETVKKLTDQIIPTLNPAGLVWLAGKVRGCCISISMECLEKAKNRAATGEDVLLVARALKEFALAEEAIKFIKANLRMTYNTDTMKLFLAFTKQEGMADIEQQILSLNIEWRNYPSDLIKIAEVFYELNYPASVKRALGKATEKEENSSGLARIASAAIQWKQLEVAQTALIKIIDVKGPEGAAMLFKDPMLLPVCSEKPVIDNPSVGVVIGIIAEKLGDLKTAESYYTTSLNLELYNGFMCIGSSQQINFANFFYPYRFFVAQKNTKLVSLLDLIGRKLEQSLIEQLKKEMQTNLESEIQAQKNRLAAIKSELWSLKLKMFFRRAFMTLFSVFCIIIAVIFVIAQVVAVQRMLEWLKPLDHLKTAGGFLKMLELEGFIIGAFLTFAPLGFFLIIISQIIVSILLKEAHAFRLSEHQRTGKGQDWVKLPLTYRD
jgi:hypothetical protein